VTIVTEAPRRAEVDLAQETDESPLRWRKEMAYLVYPFAIAFLAFGGVLQMV
jgi:hypothetical protein